MANKLTRRIVLKLHKLTVRTGQRMQTVRGGITVMGGMTFSIDMLRDTAPFIIAPARHTIGTVPVRRHLAATVISVVQSISLRIMYHGVIAVGIKGRGI